MKLYRSQSGDTILEVLIAVSVLSLILTTSFALASRSTQATRQAAERSEASKIAQQELEKLKLYMSSPGVEVPDEDEYFCLNDDATQLISVGDVSDDSNPDDMTFSTPIYLSAASRGCKDGVNDLYYKFIQRGAGADSKTYTSHVRWPAVTGNGVDKVGMVHRINPYLEPTITSVVATPPPAPTPTNCPNMDVDFTSEDYINEYIAWQGPTNPARNQQRVDLPSPIPGPCNYVMTVVTYDETHPTPPAVRPQNDERIFFEGYNTANPSPLFRTGLTGDIPANGTQTTSTLNFMVGAGTTLNYMIAKHMSISPVPSERTAGRDSPNSVHGFVLQLRRI